jgi:hypothetical protein
MASEPRSSATCLASSSSSCLRYSRVKQFGVFRLQKPARRSKGHVSFSPIEPGHSLADGHLSRQGQAFGPFTRHLFEKAGISRGVRVLDLGCGSREVVFLAAALVGLSDKVVADRYLRVSSIGFRGFPIVNLGTELG